MSEHPLTKSREIARRIVITGALQLQTPTHLGNGDTNGITDMPLLLDEASGRALLPGTSLAGALRAYVRECIEGYPELLNPGEDEKDRRKPQLDAASRRLLRASRKLFGGEKGTEKEDDEGRQSALIIEEALGGLPRVELRDGVRIDPATRTAYMEERGGKQRGFKYDLELLEPGTTFDLCFELPLPAEGGDEMLAVLALALDGLAKERIGIGLRKRRGFGRCKVTEWSVTTYDLTQPADLLGWLAMGRGELGAPRQPETGPDIAQLLGVQLPAAAAQKRFTLQADFRLDGSLLIRSGFGAQDSGPDTVHLHTAVAGRAGEKQPVLSGTSLAGALRARSRRILRALDGREDTALSAAGDDLLDRLFGPAKIEQGDKRVHASRLLVHETAIRNVTNLVQNRIRIDRFTGGAFDSGLFSEQPVFGAPQTCVHIELEVRNPTKAEMGLLLLLLKELWLGKLPLGGESSIGRGRLEGISATMHYAGESWSIGAAGDDGKLTVVGRAAMDECIAALKQEVGA